MKTIKETAFHLPGQTGFYKGKVRDVYHFDHKLVVVVSDRISAFDVVFVHIVSITGYMLLPLSSPRICVAVFVR